MTTAEHHHRLSTRRRRTFTILALVVLAPLVAVGLLTTREAGTTAVRVAGSDVPEEDRPEAIVQRHLQGARRPWPVPTRIAFQYRQLGLEVTDQNRVLEAAELSQAERRVLEIDAAGDWVEQRLDEQDAPVPDTVFMRSYADHVGRMWVNGQLEGPLVDSSRFVAAGGELGAPLAILGPFGAEPPLAAAQQALDDRGGSRTLAEEPCAEGTPARCVRARYELPAERPPADAEYYRSLPWRTRGNVETRDIVYDPETLDVYLEREAVNGVVTFEYRVLNRSALPDGFRHDPSRLTRGPAGAPEPRADHPVEVRAADFTPRPMRYADWQAARSSQS